MLRFSSLINLVFVVVCVYYATVASAQNDADKAAKWESNFIMYLQSKVQKHGDNNKFDTIRLLNEKREFTTTVIYEEKPSLLARSKLFLRELVPFRADGAKAIVSSLVKAPLIATNATASIIRSYLHGGQDALTRMKSHALKFVQAYYMQFVVYTKRVVGMLMTIDYLANFRILELIFSFLRQVFHRCRDQYEIVLSHIRQSSSYATSAVQSYISRWQLRRKLTLFLARVDEIGLAIVEYFANLMQLIMKVNPP